MNDIKGDAVLIKAFNPVCNELGIMTKLQQVILPSDNIPELVFELSNTQREHISLMLKIVNKLYEKGNDYLFVAHWLNTENHYFNGKPVDVCVSLSGAQGVYLYLVHVT